MNATFVVNKDQLDQTKLVENNTPQLFEGEILFKVDKYYLSSNNITYAVIGEKYKYWNFFPQDSPFGAIPVWAFLSVIESKHPTIKVGERFFGFSPMTNFFKVSVGNHTPHGFSDVASHRTELIAPYNYYTHIHKQYDGAIEEEDFSLMTRITFPTSFLINNFLEEEAFFSAKQIILTSASSKTALGLAFLLKKHQNKYGKEIVGLTSSKNKKMVTKSEFYDKVISYSDLKNELQKKDSVVLDFSGNSDLLTQLNKLLQTSLKYTTLIGITDWKSNKFFEELPATFPFAVGVQYQKLAKKLGPQKATELVMEQQDAFTKAIQKIVSLSYIKDLSSLPVFYQKLLNGETSPQLGYIVQP